MKPAADVIELPPATRPVVYRTLAPPQTEPIDGVLVPASTDDGKPSIAADLLELTKPRMNFLVVLTTLAGFFVAWRVHHTSPMDWLLLTATIAGTALTAAAAGVLNQWLEIPFDALMPRTQSRPLPAGRVGPELAMWFGVALAAVGLAVLAWRVNLLTAGLGFGTLVWYLAFYTPLKRFTPLNTLVGAVPGAIPPLMGFSAADGRVTMLGLAVFAILFAWQLPHFMAIAIMYRDDYRLGGFRMLPCVDPALSATARTVVIWAALLIPISASPVLGGLGIGYGVAAVLLSSGYLWAAITCARQRSRPAARRLFLTSIIHLPLLLLAMVLSLA
jgi:heme o synthase